MHNKSFSVFAASDAGKCICNTIVWRKQNQRNGQFKWNELNEEKRRHTHALRVNCSSEIRSIWTEKKKQKSDKYTERKTWKHENDNENKSEKQWKIVHINERATATALSPGNASLFLRALSLSILSFYMYDIICCKYSSMQNLYTQRAHAQTRTHVCTSTSTATQHKHVQFWNQCGKTTFSPSLDLNKTKQNIAATKLCAHDHKFTATISNSNGFL